MRVMLILLMVAVGLAVVFSNAELDSPLDVEAAGPPPPRRA
jgi:hypothetical protein